MAFFDSLSDNVDFFNQSGSVWMPSCRRAWPSRLMREKGDVSVMYSYLLIEAPMGQKVRRSPLLCLPRQPSHTLRTPLLPCCSVLWHFSCKHSPRSVKNRVVFCYLSSFSSKKVKWRKCRLLDKKCCISWYVVLLLVLHRLPEKMLSHISLRHRALIMEENSSKSVSNAVRGPFIPRNN